MRNLKSNERAQRRHLSILGALALMVTLAEHPLAQQGRPAGRSPDRPTRQSNPQNTTPPQRQTEPTTERRAPGNVAPTDDTNNSPAQPSRRRLSNDDSVLQRQSLPRPDGLRIPASFPAAVRSINGMGNNQDHPDWGSVNVEFLRLAEPAYSDGSDAPAGDSRPSARYISNVCAAQSQARPNSRGATDFFWQWGQFLDHDIDLTPVVDPKESFPVAVPTGDPWFDPQSSGTQTIPLDRSLYNVVNGVRQQVNEITAFIDASNVYGSDSERANALRTLDGTGRLKVSTGDLPPFNTAGLANAPTAHAPNFFLAGDFRANEQVALLSMHTVFIREHNYWADALSHGNPDLSGDTIYEAARAIVAGEMQAITYREFLPVLLGRNGVRPYRGYNPDVNPGIANEFATAAYRFGHTMLSTELLRVDAAGQTIPNGNLSLADAFFSPDLLIEDGIDPILRGLAAQVAQEVDTFCVDDVRNFLFGPPGAGGFDLASLNIQRGRDHGLADFNQTRIDYGLRPVRSMADINPDPAVQTRLANAYGSVNNIDLWVGGLAEAHVEDALVGRTFHTIIKDQFERLRDGDRFWYERYLPDNLVQLVEQQTLARIIRRNTAIGNELPNNVFVTDATQNM